MSASYRTRARIRDARGARIEALELLAEGTDAAVRLELPRLHAELSLERVRFMVGEGDLGRAHEVVQSMPRATGRQDG
ncbi:hypothetical protein PJI23_31770, partial [Mycobacterium kansasii]